MKKTEAISILATSVRPREAKDRARYDEAVKMAIEALRCSEIPNSSDSISRQAAIDAIGNLSDEIYGNIEKGATFPPKAWFDGMAQAEHIVRNLPPAQPEIIRCKDCKYGAPNGRYGCTAYHYRKYETHDMKPDDFCSRAERRTDG